MRCTAAFVAALLATAAPLAAQDDYPIKVYPCCRLKEAPKIDGDLTDACWKAAPLVSGFTRYNKPELLAVQTSFRVGYDDACLYFAVRCDEPRAKALVAQPAGRDTGGVFRGETVEIFVDPAHDHATYYQLAVNFAGSFYDSKKQETSWNSRSRWKTKRLADAWTLELALPWADLGAGKPKSGRVVGFNVCRDRYAGGGRQWSNWSQTKANFHDPRRFAHAVLSPTKETLAALGDEFRKGDRRGPITLYGHEGAAEQAYLAMARTALKRLNALLDKLADEGKAEASDAVREEMAARLKAARARVKPYADRIGAARRLDAAEWTRLSIDLAKLETYLKTVLWEARLAALLKEI